MANSRARGSTFIVSAILDPSTNNSIQFVPIGGLWSLQSTATESGAQLTTSAKLILKRIRVQFKSSDKNANTTYTLRDDAADTTVLTQVTSAITPLDSGVLSTIIASGSKINFEIDTSASASGSVLGTIYAELQYS